jgi:H+/Cl- antiporter ClcA
LTGVLTSLAVNLYKACAKHVISFSEQSYHYISGNLYLIPLVLIIFVAPAFLFAYIYKRIPNLRGGGIPTSIGILRGIISFKWLRNLIGIFSMSLMSFFIGVPLGNEGPSVQMGVAIGRGSVYSFGKKHRAWDRYSMTGGACSGFAVATGAPISGILFAVEEAHQRISPMILMIASTSVMFACMTTELVAPILGVSKTLFPSMQLPALSIKDVWIPLLVGVVMGLFAVLFLTYYKVIFKFSNKILKRIPHGLRIFSVFALTFAAGLVSFSTISTGHELILDLISVRTPLLILFLLLIIRSTLTLFANSNRVTGGIFLPLMAIGALLSSIIATVIDMLWGLDPSYYTVIIIIGIIACIAGMMKMPLTAIVFAVEALSCYDNVIFVIIAAGVAFVITEIFGAESINDRVLENLAHEINAGREQKFLEGYVTVGKNTFAEGMHIRDIFWPNGTFVLSHKHTLPADQRDKRALKAIHEGDVLHLRCTTFDEKSTKEKLVAILGEDAASITEK